MSIAKIAPESGCTCSCRSVRFSRAEPTKSVDIPGPPNATDVMFGAGNSTEWAHALPQWLSEGAA